jgi:hypothetical protein
MAVGFRAAGAWENGATGLTADEVLAVPAAQLNTDLVLILAAWKDFAITAQVSGYTEITEFADGTTNTGNGLGSMKVGAWYKVAVSDTEADPTLDFSTTTGLLGEGTILVFTKAGGETWLAPTFVTAAWPITANPQTISASSTVLVPDGSAVVGLLGIRDDSSTFTRVNTTGIDVASGITWNGNYVESPATHASTTTGNDMSCDAGYRLVTTGGTVTLRQTATLSAVETGSGLWVVLGVFTPDPKTAAPTPGALVVTGATPTVTKTANVTAAPTAASMTATGATPTVTKTSNVFVAPTVAAMTATGATPTVLAPALSLPGSVALTLTPVTPTVAAIQVYAPDAAALTSTGATPAVLTPVLTEPAGASMAVSGAAPDVALAIFALPTAAPLVTSLETPDVLTPVLAVPDVAPLTLALETPDVVTPVLVQPDALALAFAFGSPVIGDALFVEAGGLIVTGDTPDVLAPALSLPPAAELATTLATPIVEVSGTGVIQPEPAELVMTGAASAVTKTEHVHVDPAPATVTLTGAIPGIGFAFNLAPEAVALHLSFATPSVQYIDEPPAEIPDDLRASIVGGSGYRASIVPGVTSEGSIALGDIRATITTDGDIRGDIES